MQQERGELVRAIEVERTRLETELRQLLRSINEDLAPLAQSEPALAESLAESRRKLAGLSEEAADLSQIRLNAQALATEVGEAQTLASRYQAEGEQIKEKLGILSQADPHSVVCPLCLSPLSEDGCQRLAQNYEAEIEEKRDLYRTNRDSLRTLESRKLDLESNLAKREKAYNREASRIQGEIGQAEAKIVAGKAGRYRTGGNPEQVGSIDGSLER